MVIACILTYIAIMFLGIGVSLAEHGKTVKRNGLKTIISYSIITALMYGGGFFDPLFR